MTRSLKGHKIAFGLLLFAGLAVEPVPTAAQARDCPKALTDVAKTLHINPKFANEHDIGVACTKANKKPALASRNFRDRFVTAHNIK